MLKNFPFSANRITRQNFYYALRNFSFGQTQNGDHQVVLALTKLKDLGFLEGIVAETIISTYDKDGKPNAAPMGVMLEDGQLISKLYNSTSTLRNIKANPSAVVNLTSNIEIFYKTALKEVNIDGKLPETLFEPAKLVKAPKIQHAEAKIEVAAISLASVGKEKTKVTFKVKLIEAPKKYPQIHSRAHAATIEAIIHATRVKLFINDEKQKKRVRTLLKMIANCSDIVNRTAPNSKYSSVMADLNKRIDTWRKNH